MRENSDETQAYMYTVEKNVEGSFAGTKVGDQSNTLALCKTFY